MPESGSGGRARLPLGYATTAWPDPRALIGRSRRAV